MRIDVLEEFDVFERLRSNWDSVYEADPDSQFFLSWAWLSKALSLVQGPWLILAARPSEMSDYVAFFPLRLRTKERREGGFYNQINMAGNFSADYTGFICRPEFEEEAIPALARHMKRMNWAQLHLDNIRCTERRLRLFLHRFLQAEFRIEKVDRVNKRDSVDNNVCPFVALPTDWETYLAQFLSANTRQKLRRVLRQVESSDEFRITLADASTVERDLKILLDFWAAKWKERKGQFIPGLLRSNFRMLRGSFEVGALFLPVLWRGDQPLAALASLVDPVRKSVLFYITGRDETFNNPPPGLILHAFSIRYAIAQGFRTYDFLRGDEAYKYSFGVEERRINCIRIATSNGRNLGGKLDPRCVRDALRRSSEHHSAGRLVEAERGYRDVLASDPKNPTALVGLGQILSNRGDHAVACRLLETALAVKPGWAAAEIWLAASLQALNRLPEAIAVYRRLTERHPQLSLPHSRLGALLFRLGRLEGALDAFEKALALQPDNPELEVRWANTRYLLGRLPVELRGHYAVLNAEVADKARDRGAAGLAAQLYRQAIHMAPELVRAHYGLGLALVAAGDRNGALASYRHVVMLDPDHREALAFLGPVPSVARSKALDPARAH